MNKLFLIISFFLSVTSAYSQNLSQEELINHFNKAQEYNHNKNYAAAMREYKIVSGGKLLGMPEYEIAILYYEGKGCQANLTEYANWMEKAAQYGFPKAYVELGHIYYDGTGRSQNLSEAVKWYRKAAENGDALGAHCMGMSYYGGEGVERNSSQAIYWYKKAAEKGLSASANNLGSIYLRGDGVNVSIREAMKWLNIGADKGDRNAQYTLGVLYYEGSESIKQQSGDKDCPYFAKDYKKALDYFSKAAAQGHVGAQIKITELSAQ